MNKAEKEFRFKRIRDLIYTPNPQNNIDNIEAIIYLLDKGSEKPLLEQKVKEYDPNALKYDLRVRTLLYMQGKKDEEYQAVRSDILKNLKVFFGFNYRTKLEKYCDSLKKYPFEMNIN